ncbi:glycosyltransferase family 2 protein [Patescibacteria group bacterium]|nr:glycosyltransferase family 2 protein [Patescibacteria group bacterium]
MKTKTSNKNPEVSIILPCLNEEQSLGTCLEKIKKVVRKNNLNAEIIVVDNGSTDNSCKIAKRKKVKIIYEPKRGYGSAFLKGFEVAKGKYFFCADSDGSYDFREIPRFIEELKKGSDFVIGDRFKGKVKKGAMPWFHRYIGNPMLSGILRLFFKTKIQDVHCGMRTITKKALKELNLRATGMEFASEMVIQAVKKNLKTKEIPIDYHKRKGTSKLKSFRDGWKHLRFMLLYSPLFLFFIPGVLLFLIGLISMLWLYFGSLNIFGIEFQYHPMFLSALLIIIGYQLIIFSLFAKTYAINHLGEKPIFNKLYKYLTIEKAGIVGIIIVLLGIIIFATIFFKWLNTGFGELDEIKNSITALTLIIVGIQTIFSSFMLSILGIKEK